ncbi:hypothetical protein Val02_79900 [Virgisporangium aliadipatigenens]|uniref:Uncharacterized protein n=1 Tax=Virgisporangium aliadipatigenens TaxID=741659 RepID=A0A8J3YSX8_9ACTN|nr:hypothetical protein [Virgisporangium aliadipatigenens]GIJ51104.1 hypothetical protein Val02_79900 [Virgisporangium aliadipatigenens]
MRTRILRSVAALVCALAVLGIPVHPASAAPTPAPADPESGPFARSSSTTYRVTLVARSCAAYGEVMANQVRDDDGESPGKPGRETAYTPGQAVDPDIEARDNACTPLPGAKFTFGAGREKTGPLSTVTAPREPLTAADGTARLDGSGKTTGATLAGAVTTILTDEQLRLTARRQLWLQGGATGALVPGGHSFGVLRCGVDGRTAGNVQWVTFPAGVRHVFCYAYYVRGSTATGTFAVKLRTTRPVGYPQRIGFQGSISQAGGFSLTADASETSFARLAGEQHQVQPVLPAGWRVADVTCAGSHVAADPATGHAQVTLVANETASCAYAVEPPAAAAGLTVRLYSEGGAGKFGVTVNGTGTSSALVAEPRGDGSAVTAAGADLSRLAPGAYTVSVQPPVADAKEWTLASATCNGAPVTVQSGTLQALVGAGVATDCVLRVIRRQATVSLKVVTQGGVATAGFALVPSNSGEPGWGASATTGNPGTSTAATGDLPQSVPFGAYIVVPVPPVSTADASWRLAGLGCQPGNAAGADSLSLRVDVNASTAAVECTATYQQQPAIRVRVALRAEGPGQNTDAVVDVSCGDGSAGRAVLAGDESGPSELPTPLSFADKTPCTVSLPEGADRPKAAALLVEPAPGNAPLPLPATVALDQPGTEYTLTVTLVYEGEDEGGQKTAAGALNSFTVLPFALIGSGLVGIGAAILLVMVARRRMGIE